MSRHPVIPPLSWRVPAALLCLALLGCGGPTVTSSPEAPSSSERPATAPSAAPSCAPTASPPEAPAPWWRDRIFYEVFVRSFADSNGDGIGDLRGLTDRLDYLNDGDPATTEDLGVTGIWLMPVAESPSYHGYDVVDYEAIESDYGTRADFEAFLSAARARGIAVIVDLVMNHTSIEHPWFRDARTPGSAHDDWYVWSESGVPFGGPSGRRVWHQAGDRWYYGYFWEGMPDLNVANPEVQAALDEVAAFWLDELGVDGFRLDAARHLIEDDDKLENTEATFDWLEGFRSRTKAVATDALVLGEVWDATSMSSKYVRDGALDLTFDFALAGATLASINSRDANSVRAALREVAEAYPADGLATFLTNHDQNRVADALGGDSDAAKLAATLLLTGPGIPFLYYGEEIGMHGSKPDERIRTPMRWDGSDPAAGFSSAEPWQALSNDPPGTDVAAQAADPDSILAMYRALTNLRASHPALGHGTWIDVDASESSVLAFVRHLPEETLIVVSNLSSQPAAVALSLADGPLCGTLAAEVIWGSGSPEAPTVTRSGGFDAYEPVPRLGPRETLIFGLSAR
jgi:glycosidase